MNYSQIKKLDEETLEKLTEGKGPSDKCLCSLLYSPDDGEKKGIRASIKKAFASIGGGKKKKAIYGQNTLDIPLAFDKGGKGLYTTKEVVKRKTPCGRCGCDSDLVLKHSFANIRITSPDIDVSSICSCPSNCMPELREKLQSNIKVTVEHLSVMEQDPASEDAEGTPYPSSEGSRQTASEPTLSRNSESTLGGKSAGSKD